MRSTLFFVTLLLYCVTAFSANYETQLLTRETYKLNSGSRLGGTSRVSVPVTLPAGTVAVFYTVQTSKKAAPAFIDIATQVANAIKTNPVKTTANLLALVSHIHSTTGDGVTDVYLMQDERQRICDRQRHVQLQRPVQP